MERDLALVCELSLQADTLLDQIKASASNLLIDAKIFDIYKGAQLTEMGKMSVAVKLTFQSAERTLKDNEVNQEIENVLAGLKDNLGITLR